MPLDPEPAVQLPLLNRLIDLDPGIRAEPHLSRPAAIRMLKDALRRDLEHLLNTRRTPVKVPREMPEVAESVFCYGMPDLTSLSLRSAADRSFLKEMIAKAITDFEPRLTDVRIVNAESSGTSERTLHFQIEALLLVDPAPEVVSFDTVFKVDQGACEVNG